MAVPSSLLLISLLSLALTQATSQESNSNVTLAGIVTCINSSIATVKTYSFIPEAKVDVVCGILLLEKVIKSTTTNFLGIYSFSLNEVDMALLDIPDLCHLNVTMPANSCVFEPSGGFLKFPIISIRSALPLGKVIAYVPGAPSYSHM